MTAEGLRQAGRPGAWRRTLGARARALLALLAGLCFVAAPAFAWNFAGHRLVASIAWSQMQPGARQQAQLLLIAHPDYERWLRRVPPASLDPAGELFIAASTWPDEIRKDARFYDPGEAPTPLLPGFPGMERHRDWHYLNRPLGETGATPAVRGELDRQLVALAAALDLRRSGASAEQKSYALPWLIHLVGDAHQPLHASLRQEAGDEADERLIVINPFKASDARRQRSTLHAFWDDLPGPAALRGEKLEARKQALLAAYAPPAPATSAEWLAESWQLARDHAYPRGAANPITIEAQFYENSVDIANRRVSAAGYRLAALLNGLLQPR